MARIRSVHPSLFTDEAWVSCSALARLLAIGLWTDADDQGAFEWKPLQIKMRLLPGDNVDASILLGELSGAGLIMSYEIGGRRFGAIRNFRRFQRPKKPHHVHPTTPEVRTYVALDGVGSEPVPPQTPTEGEIAPQREEEGGRREEEEEEADASSVGSRSKSEPWLADPDFVKAWDACTEHGRKRSSRKASWGEWRKVRQHVDGPCLAEAMVRYVSQDEDAKRTGGPAFHRWLHDGRWEHWLDGTPTIRAVVTYDGPPELRAEVVSLKGEDFASSCIDMARFRANPPTLIPRTAWAADQIRRELGGLLRSRGITLCFESAA